ncbi:MAG: ABC transporter permease [Candidatus Aminicenantia bacterium]
MNKELVKEIIKISIDSIKSHKMRSFLTVLGIMIGVMTLVSMVAVVDGLNRAFMKSLKSLGSDLIYIQRYEPVRIGVMTEEERHRKPLTLEDAIAIKELCPSIGKVTYMNYISPLDIGEIIVKYRDREVKNPDYYGVNPDYWEVFENPIQDGRFFTEEEMLHRANVCVLGMEVVESLFPREDPIGKEIYINGIKFKVLGTLEKKGRIFGQTQDKVVAIPFHTFKKLHPKTENVFISAKPKSPELLDKAIEEIEELLRRRRGVPFRKPSNFSIYTQDTIATLYRQLTTGIYAAMIVIASLALFVGGIGVMNIMLVSVRERIREIGIRKALGARNRDIMLQFLWESSILTGIGGVFGIIIGWVVSFFVKKFSPIPATISLWSVLLGLFISVSVGLIFGVFPAQKAASQSPIEALRYE